MQFDCHTHVAEKYHISGLFLKDAQKAWGSEFRMACSLQEHRDAMKHLSGAIVLAVDAPHIGFVVPNEYVAEYVAEDPTRLFGFASVDPNRPGAAHILEHAIKELKLKGLKLAPIYQNFHPADSCCYPLYAKAQELKIPIMWHQGTSFVAQGPLEKSQPVDLDPVARAFPNLKMIIAHMGHPWTAEAVCVVRKQPNMFLDISALSSRPWQMYNAFLQAVEYGIEDKLLFGTDFPFFNVQQTVEALYQVNRFTAGTSLPCIPERVIELILSENIPETLGLV